MIGKTLVPAFTLLLALFSLTAKEAEAQVYFGPQVVAWDLNDVGVGARVDIGLGQFLGLEEGLAAGLFGTVNGSYLFIGNPNVQDDLTHLTFNANVGIPFGMTGAVVPYAGAGIHRYRISAGGGSAGRSGLNLLGGIFFDLGSLPAYAEIQHSTTGRGFLTLSFGFLFGG